MSVLIKGMEMPETCDGCPFHHYHSVGEYVCEATPMFYPWNLANTKGARKEWCPLVELPPHGRLIDADALKAAICEALKNALDDDSVNIFGAVLAEFVAQGFTDEIENAPTIIPAEEADG